MYVRGRESSSPELEVLILELNIRKKRTTRRTRIECREREGIELGEEEEGLDKSRERERGDEGCG